MVTADTETTPKRSSSTSIWLGLGLFVVLMIGIDIWFFQKTIAPNPNDLPKININVLSASSFVVENALNQEDNTLNQSLNILVLGKSGGDYISPDLTDSIFIVHIDNVAKTVKIISIPRDLAVNIPNTKNIAKINSLYIVGLKTSEQEGLALIKEKVQEVTGLTINNFVMFDLTTVEKIIDDIGGINVYVSGAIYDTRFPTPDGGYQTFKLDSGWRFLDGQTAMMFVRTRHNPDGDFGRIQRQQELLKAIKGRLVSLNPVWDFPKLWSIFNSVQNDVRTDLDLNEIKKLWSLSKNTDLDKLQTLSLSTENGLVVPKAVLWGGQTADILVATPTDFDYAKIQKVVNGFINSQ